MQPCPLVDPIPYHKPAQTCVCVPVETSQTASLGCSPPPGNGHLHGFKPQEPGKPPGVMPALVSGAAARQSGTALTKAPLMQLGGGGGCDLGVGYDAHPGAVVRHRRVPHQRHPCPRPPARSLRRRPAAARPGPPRRQPCAPLGGFLSSRLAAARLGSGLAAAPAWRQAVQKSVFAAPGSARGAPSGGLGAPRRPGKFAYAPDVYRIQHVYGIHTREQLSLTV